MYLGPSTSDQFSTPSPTTTPQPFVAIFSASSSAAATPSPAPFSLSQHAPNRTAYTAMTRMPSVATLDQLEALTPFVSSVIKDCLSNIYFHVVHRDADNLAVFFHHLGATVMYETYSAKLINDANHAIKAAGIVNLIDKTLNQINQSKSNVHTNLNQKQILLSFEIMIIMHKNILIEALQGASAEVKAHIKAHQNLDVEASQILPLSPQKHEMIKQQFPTTPSPQKGKGTPKKLSEQDKVSIAKLKPKVIPLKFESSSEEEEDSLSNSDNSLDDDAGYDSGDSDDSLDALLMGEANKGFTPYFSKMDLEQGNTFDLDSDFASYSDEELDDHSDEQSLSPVIRRKKS